MGLQILLLCSAVMLLGVGVRGQVTKPPPTSEYPGDYIVLAPNTIHPGLPLTLSVNILKADAGAVLVTANILKVVGGPVTIVTNSSSFNGGSSGVLELRMPSDATTSSYNLQVMGSGTGLRFDETQSLTFKREGFSILVQSDKAIYKPGQTIMFRAMAVYPDLKPYTGMFDIEMKDPDGNVVKQWMDLQNAEYGVVSGEMFMSEEARLGDWIVKVIANGQEYEHTVEVSEYVLPKFEVKLILPPFLTSTDTEIAGMVEAKYTYGQPVKGVGTVTLKYKPQYGGGFIDYIYEDVGETQQGEQPPSIVRSNIKIDGTGDIRFTMKEISSAFDIDLQNAFNEDELVFTAEVTENLTSIKQMGSGTVGISKYPIKITEVTGNPENYKPGLPYTAYASVTHLDDSPLTAEERQRGVVVRVIKDYKSDQPTDNIHSIPENGIVKFGIVPGTDAENYEIQVFYREYLPKTNYYCGNLGSVCLSLSLRKAESPTNTYLQITSESNDLTAGDSAVFNILTTEVPGTLQYQVLSRGDIVHTASITATTTETQLAFTVTADMAPSPRLIVFYLKDDGEVILASINFKVDGVFENDVTISAAVDKVEPGQDVSFDITAASNSFIGILAIDQSVRLLKTGNDITQDQVLQKLDNFDTTSNDNNFGPVWKRRRRDVANGRSKRSAWCRWCWFPIGGSTVKDVVNNAGMLVFTNGQLYGGEDTFWPPVYYDAVAGPGPVPGPAFRGDAGDYLEDAEDEVVTKEGSDNSQPSKTRIRTEFPETWLWADYIAE